MVFLLSTFISRKFYYLLPFLCPLSSSLLTPTLKALDLTLKSDFSKLVSTYENEQMTLVFVTHKLFLPPSFILLFHMYVYGCMVYTQIHTLTHIHTQNVFVVCVHMVED